MGFIRTHKTKDYTIMSNHHLNNCNLSLKSKGLLSFMLSKPNNWNFSVNGLKSQLKEGRDSISSTLKELEENNYLIREQVRNDGGNFIKKIYHIFEKPTLVLPITENPISDNTIQVNTKEVNTKEVIIKKDNSKIKKTEKVFSEDVFNCYNNCLNFFPLHLHPKNKKSWIETIEKLNRIDEISFDDIELIIQKAREDSFWKMHFLSINKLRQKKDGVSYFSRFVERFKGSDNKFNQTASQKLIESVRKDIESGDLSYYQKKDEFTL